MPVRQSVIVFGPRRVASPRGILTRQLGAPGLGGRHFFVRGRISHCLGELIDMGVYPSPDRFLRLATSFAGNSIYARAAS